MQVTDDELEVQFAKEQHLEHAIIRTNELISVIQNYENQHTLTV